MAMNHFSRPSGTALSMNNRDRIRESAEARFKKAEVQLLNKESAMSEYEEGRRAVNANMARLKALRLARDALAVAVAKPAKIKRSRKLSA